MKGLVYVAAQSAGAVVGAALLRGLVPADSIRGEHCFTGCLKYTQWIQGVLITVSPGAAGLGCTGLNSALSAGQVTNESTASGHVTQCSPVIGCRASP